MDPSPEPEARTTLHFEVPPGQSRIRLDVYLTHSVENATRTKVREAIDDGRVTVNGHTVKPSTPVLPGDRIDVVLLRPPRTEPEPENIPLKIVHEDEHLLVVMKPAGMVTHPAYGNASGTLVNALLHHVGRLSALNEGPRPGIVHRLDKETSGLMVVAKTDAAHAHLARQFAARTIEREYQALVWGRMKSPHGIIDAGLARSKRDRTKVAVSEEGKHAVTEYTVLESFDFLTLLRLKLRTGRTHQIRVHLAHIGHPVFGDPTYGGRVSTWGGLAGKKHQQAANLLKIIGRQALHAKSIGFIHPATGQHLRFDSELPDDIRSVIERIRP